MKQSNFIILLSLMLSVAAQKFKVIREWNYLNFSWPNDEVYQTAISKGLYVPENNIIAGVKYYEDHYYLTLPRMKNGVPVTLARISAGSISSTSPALEPFPSWEMNNLNDCNAFQNVQNVEIDSRGQIWVIDGGRTETLSSTPTTRCPAKLVIFDINKNMTTTAYTFPDNVASYNSSFLYDIVVDNSEAGFAYITDNSAKDPGIIVFSVKDHHSWKIRHSQSMHADPRASTFLVNGVMVSAPINIAGIALGPKARTSSDRLIVSEDRVVYFSPLSSLHIYSVNTSVLRNELNGMNNGEYQGDVKDYGMKASQSVAMTMDNQGILYYGMLGTNSIAQWDTRAPFLTAQKIIAKDERFLEWPSSFTFDLQGNITVVVNRLNRFIYDKLNLNEPNFRLITARVGSKSYIYDQGLEYNSEELSSTEIPVTLNMPEPHVPYGSDQDPFIAPEPQPHPSDKESGNTSEATTESTTMKHDVTQDPGHFGHNEMHHNEFDKTDTDHNHDNRDQQSTTVSPKDSGATKLVTTIFGIVLASIFFIV